MSGQGRTGASLSSSENTGITTSTRSHAESTLLTLLIKQLRPLHWSKNVLVFAALIFTIPRVTSIMLIKEIWAFVLFCLVSGCVYILNDYLDLQLDQRDPQNCHRPMASGRLSPRTAIRFGALILVICLPSAWLLNCWFAASLFAYLLLNIAYSTYLKNVVIMDIFAIAAGFVLRAAAGGFAISVMLTPWFLLCAMVLSLFLATGKRKYEFMVWQKSGQLHRKVLTHYSQELLDQLSSVTAASVIMTYSMFTFSPGHTRYLMITIPLVAYGVFRYFYLLHIGGQGGHPETILLKDNHIRLTVVLFTIFVITLLYLFG